jgi:hypothetical protein
MQNVTVEMKSIYFIVVVGLFSLGAFSCSEDGSDTPLVGKGGSLARFAVTNTHLYSVDADQLHVYQIMPNGGLEKINSSMIGPGVETIFALGENLYIGKNDAMVTYNISHPASPAYVSTYSHFVACDPVVVQDTLAFVTVRSNNCRNANFNSLDIINMKNPQAPTLLSNYTLESPYGLGVDGNLLFVCEGDYGLKVFDVSNPFSAVLLKKYTDMHAYDVIPRDGILILTGDDGIAQYDYSNPPNIRRLSTIAVQK